MPKVHIIGAGLAGLAAAIRLIAQGYEVAIYEAAGQAGGRCRSFFDKELDHRIDNGNHLLLSGNRSAQAYLREIRSENSLEGPPDARFPFVDLQSHERWVVAPGKGVLPAWLFNPAARVPDTRLVDYWSLANILFAAPGKTVADVVPADNILFERFWEPLAVAVLNMPADKGAAGLLRPVLIETFLRGGAACRPLIAREGLGPAFIEPALKRLEEKGFPVKFNHRVRELTIEHGHVTGLQFAEHVERVLVGENVILAVPPTRAADLVPGLETPPEGEAIVNAHYRVAEPVKPWGGANLLGLVHGLSQWIFLRGNIVSITISAAGHVKGRNHDELIPLLWEEVCTAFDLGGEKFLAARIIKEKRATFDQSPSSVAKRPGTRTGFKNLFLAGDWTDTGLPATIEGAIRSGHQAARHVRMD